jgi:glycosyltransferase involved in cell wall biosynthesis
MTPIFSVVCIARNESKTLPRLLSSLNSFTSQGGEVIVVDTGSTDETVKVARNLGCVVFEEGTRFMRVIDAETAKNINTAFVVEDESVIVKDGDKLFDFSAARNYAASCAKNEWVLMMDCDEALTKLNLEKVIAAITSRKSLGRLEFEFVYAHDQFGQPIIQFRMSRFYDRCKFWWNPKSIVHEVLTNIPGTNAESVYLGEDVLKSEHWQNPTTNRSGYLVGLALDCFLHPDNDRNSHYFGRELFYKGRYRSAIKEFERHIDLNGWPVERAQSMIYIGDCYKSLGHEELALLWWNKAFLADGTRREPLMRLAHHFFAKEDKHKTAAYASAALALPRIGAYMDNENHYRQEPHELLYWALWYLGDQMGSADHWRKAISYQPTNAKYLNESVFYMRTASDVITLTRVVKSGQNFSFVKLGDGERACMMGATGANCDGQPFSPALSQALTSAYEFLAGKVQVVDFSNQKTFNMLLNRTDNNLADVKAFWDSISARTDVKVFVGPARLKPAAELLKARFIEVPLVDAFAEEEYIMQACLEHCKRNTIFIFSAGMLSKVIISRLLQMCPDMTCIDAGSAFDPLFVGETRTFQAPKSVLENLYFGTAEVVEPHVTICIPTLGREEKLQRLLDSIPATAEYKNYDVLVERDSFENRIGVPKLLHKMVANSKGEFIVFLGNDCIPKSGWLRRAMSAMRQSFQDMDGLVGFNDGYSHGTETPHWLASKKLLLMLDGEFFHAGYHHVGCDNELVARCKKSGKYVWCEEAHVFHDHPLHTGMQEKDMDDTYKLAWRSDLVLKDRELLKSRANQLGF